MAWSIDESIQHHYSAIDVFSIEYIYHIVDLRTHTIESISKRAAPSLRSLIVDTGLASSNVAKKWKNASISRSVSAMI